MALLIRLHALTASMKHILILITLKTHIKNGNITDWSTVWFFYNITWSLLSSGNDTKFIIKPTILENSSQGNGT